MAFHKSFLTNFLLFTMKTFKKSLVNRAVFGLSAFSVLALMMCSCQQDINSPVQPQQSNNKLALSEDERRHIRETETSLQRQILAGLDNVNADGTIQKIDTVISDTNN